MYGLFLQIEWTAGGSRLGRRLGSTSTCPWCHPVDLCTIAPLSAAIIGLVGRVCGDEPESLPLSRGKESSGRNGRLPAASITGIMICSWMTNRSPFVPISALGSGVRGETLHSGPVLRGEHVHELRFANSTCSVTCLALQLAFDTECRILAGQFALLIPYMNKNFLDISWDGMRDLLLQKKCGAMMMGSWWANDFLAQSQEDYDDLWIVPFPEINPEFGRDSIDAPVDGVCAAANGANPAGGAAFAEWCGSEAGMLAAQGAGDTSLYANTRLDTSGYDAFNKQKLAVIGEAKNVMNFLDRDCRNDFAGTIVGPAIQNFLKNPKDVNGIVDSMQEAWDALPELA